MINYKSMLKGIADKDDFDKYLIIEYDFNSFLIINKQWLQYHCKKGRKKLENVIARGVIRYGTL